MYILVLITKYDINSKSLAMCDIYKYNLAGDCLMSALLDFGVFDLNFVGNNLLVSGSEG